MRGSQLPATEHTPDRIEPVFGQLPENSGHSPVNKGCNVLQEEQPGTRFAKDAPCIIPEVPFVIFSEAFSGAGVGLAGDSAKEEIHAATPRPAVKGREVVPDRRSIQGRIFHPRHESGRRVGFPLNVTNGSYAAPASDSKSEVEPSDSATNRDGTYIHVTLSPGT